MNHEEFTKLRFRYRMYQIGGMAIFGIGLVFLITSFMGVMSNGRTSLPAIILGFVISFLGSLLKNVGKEREKQLNEM